MLIRDANSVKAKSGGQTDSPVVWPSGFPTFWNRENTDVDFRSDKMSSGSEGN